MENGWIKLHKKFTKWGWYSDINTKALFLHLLITANYEDGDYKGHPIKRGQTVIGLKATSKIIGLTLQSLRTAINHLKSTNEITIESTNQFSIVTIVKYSDYQKKDTPTNKRNNTQPNKRATNEQQTSNNTIRREERKKEESIQKKKYLDYVYLKEKEYEKLQKDFGDKKLKACIEKLDNAIPNSKAAKSYRDHNRVLRSWVSDWYNEKFGKPFESTQKCYNECQKNGKKREFTLWLKRTKGLEEANELLEKFYLSYNK